jgi:hypothetical protein
VWDEGYDDDVGRGVLLHFDYLPQDGCRIFLASFDVFPYAFFTDEFVASRTVVFFVFIVVHLSVLGSIY